MKANERNHNLHQEIKTMLENKKLIEDNLKQEIERLNEELKAERDFRRDRQQYNEIDHKIVYQFLAVLAYTISKL